MGDQLLGVLLLNPLTTEIGLFIWHWYTLAHSRINLQLFSQSQTNQSAKYERNHIQPIVGRFSTPKCALGKIRGLLKNQGYHKGVPYI